MENASKDFFSLISEITQLEAQYEKLDEERKHLQQLLYSFGKDNKGKLYTVNQDIQIKKYLIDDLTKKIAVIKLDSTMKEYYNLYKEKSELVKKYWNLKAESKFIDSRFIFDCICDDEIENQLALKRKGFVDEQESLDTQIKIIDIKMNMLHAI